MENSIVKVEHLSHRYSVQWAIRDINFEINQRGIMGLLGSNGAGKSTTMNIICGVLKQTEGNVFIDGIDLRENPVEAKKNVGFLPQKAPLHLDFTVDEYLTYCADLHMVDKKQIKAAVDEAKARCGITHFSKRVLRNLSGGYQQRVGIAQAIVHKPKFVVLDEPTNGLDPNQITEVRHLIKEIAEERSVLLSTHILSEVQATCRNIKMIENGQMIFSGSIEEFDNYIQPNTLLVELDTPPMECDLLLPGISKVETLSERRFRLRYDGDQDTAKRVAEVCVTRGWGLIELVIEKSSLDAIFAQLSKSASKGRK
ncbi:MAG: ABC transporter ATP-binding protein [Butyricimonas faecalis]|jgi:ABC-2 type transport system ATP-binding protein|uniref:ATP-binding cassette domain-containing protein n=1 Tax=Butyricimonas faecalis TaxID=2093856 RepID=A0A3S9VUJ7_9BACT|nr:ATP-binding cassette domain-containing protein [Butyricimonas faecalis]AZS30234.1 ATP-binding cassette domain-containing protein [Butyricimonas faecalis]MBS7155471.1 ATP-binding cassette domain-containing protein [Sanguibacteroides justesenii]